MEIKTGFMSNIGVYRIYNICPFMNFFKSLFSGKTIENSPDVSLSADFEGHVRNAIKLLSNAERNISDENILKLFTEHQMEYREAVEIFLFLPVAFVRHWLPEIKWPDTYIEFGNNAKRKYSKTLSFQIIWKLTNAYF